jgi:hypothetical protein
MFTVIPAGDNRFYVSCNDHDIENMKKLIANLSSNVEYIRIEICEMIELILENGTNP